MPKISGYDYETDLTIQERETRINAAIAELERNPNASRRGVARHHGLPESTLRGRMKKLKINYKSFNKDERVTENFEDYSSASPPAFAPTVAPTSGIPAVNQNVIYAQYYAQQHQLQQQHQHQQQIQSQQHYPQQYHNSSTTSSNPVPVAFFPPYKAPPMAQHTTIEYHSKIDKNYLSDEDEELKELKPSTINTQSKKAMPIKILKSNVVRFDEDNFGGILTETTQDPRERQSKIDNCVEQLTKSPHLSLRDVSRVNKVAETAIRRSLEENKIKKVEYCLSTNVESRVIEILKKFEFVENADFFKRLVNTLINEFIKQDYYSRNASLVEILDKERKEEIIVEFLWNHSDINVGGIKLQDLIDN